VQEERDPSIVALTIEAAVVTSKAARVTQPLDALAEELVAIDAPPCLRGTIES
jgi:hypothetical protein